MATQQHQSKLVYGYIRQLTGLTEIPPKVSVIYSTIIQYSERKHITIGLFGSFRTGKSTLGGRMCYEFNQKKLRNSDNDTSHERVITSKDEKWSTYFDADDEEQLRMMTIHGNINEIYTLSYAISLIDTPGYKQYLKNFLRYISQSDVALLVFSASDLIEKYQNSNGMPSTPNMDKTSFDGYYQLLDKLRICKLFDISQLIIAVNKLDKFNYSQQKYRECKTEIGRLLRIVGYTHRQKYCIIPISAVNGDNILHKSSKTKLQWWTHSSEGGFILQKVNKYNLRIYTIYDAIEFGIQFDDIQIYKNNIINIKPFRMSICSIYEETLSGGDIVSGRIESGKISVGTNVKMFPSECYGQIKSIQMFHKPCLSAGYGDIVGMSLDSFLLHPQRGDVIINESNKKEQNNFSGIASFEALIDVYMSNDKINKKYRKGVWNEKLSAFVHGFSPVIHSNNAIKQCQCQMIEILWKTNKSFCYAQNGKTMYKTKAENAKYLEPGDTGKVLFEPNRQFAISTGQKIVVLEHKQMIMAGKVVKLHYADEIIVDLK